MSAWDLQEDNEESAKAYEAFCVYRSLGVNRSLLKVWRQQSGNETATSVSGKITAWSEKYDWLNRARAYDAHLELQVRKQDEQKHVAELVAYRERARKAATDTAQIALAVLLKAGQRLQSLNANEIEPGMIPGYLRAAAAVMETSLNAEAEAIGVRQLETLLDDADKDQSEG